MNKALLSSTIALASMTISSAGANPILLVCKKRTKQVYQAYYRTEILQAPDGQLRFEYGVGDSVQTYEVRYLSPIRAMGPDIYESLEGVTPRLRIEIKARKNKRMLEFGLLDAAGKGEKREGYVCE